MEVEVRKNMRINITYKNQITKYLDQVDHCVFKEDEVHSGATDRFVVLFHVHIQSVSELSPS